MGRYDLSFEETKTVNRLFNDREELAIVEEAARVYAKSGYKAALLRQIGLHEELSKRRYFDPAFMAMDYADLGDRKNVCMAVQGPSRKV